MRGERKWNEEGNWCDFSVKRHFISLRLGGKQCANRPRGASLTRRRASAGVIGCCLRAGRCQSLMIETAPKASYVSQTCLLWLTEAQHGHWLILIFSLEIVADSWKQSQRPNTAGTNDVKARSRSTGSDPGEDQQDCGLEQHPNINIVLFQHQICSFWVIVVIYDGNYKPSLLWNCLHNLLVCSQPVSVQFLIKVFCEN